MWDFEVVTDKNFGCFYAESRLIMNLNSRL